MTSLAVLEFLERVTYPLTQVPHIDVLNFPLVSHHWLWIVGICTPLYLLLVFVGPKLMAKRQALDLKYPMIVWNLFLSTLSLFMFFGIGVPTWRATLESNANVWYHIVTLDANYDEPTWVGSHIFWVWLFGLSKVAELFDTVFLVVRKREVPFLHWYHHTTVLSFALFGMWCLAGPMFLFAIMNSFVHVVMYFYYALTGLGYRPFWGKYITQLQMLQMVVGVTSSASWAYFTLTVGTRMYKDYHLYFTTAAILMYGSYFYLFLQFYLNRYAAAAKKPAAATKKAQ